MTFGLIQVFFRYIQFSDVVSNVQDKYKVAWPIIFFLKEITNKSDGLTHKDLSSFFTILIRTQIKIDD